MLLGFLAGLFVGAVFGVILMALVSARRYDENIQKKPVLHTRDDSMKEWICPDCAEQLYAGQGFCDRCGQSIEWSEKNVG